MGSRLFVGQDFARSVTAYVSCNIAVRFLGMARGVALTWLLVRSEYGLAQVALLVISVLMPLCSFGLNEAVVRYVPAFETRGSLLGFLRRAAVLVLGIAAVTGGGLCLASEHLASLLFQNLSSSGASEASIDPNRLVLLMRLTGGAVVALVAYFLVFSVLRGLGMFRAVGLYELFNGGLFLGAVLVCVWLGYRTAEGVLVCYLGSLVVSVLAFGIPLVVVLRGWKDQQANPVGEGVVGRMLRFSVWAGFSTVVWQVLQHYPLWYLNKARGPVLAGEFSGIRQITQVVLLGAVAVTTVVVTQVTRTWEAKGAAQADRQMTLAYKTLFLAVLLGGLLLSGTRDVLVMVLGPDYRAAAVLVPSLLVFSVLGAHLSFLTVHFSLIEKTRLSAWPWLVGIAVNVILGYRWVSSGAEDPLRGAADAGVVAMVAAVAVCLPLLLVEGRPFGKRECVLLGGTALLYAPPGVLLAGGLTYVVLSCFTSMFFDAGERRAIFDVSVRLMARLRGVPPAA